MRIVGGRFRGRKLKTPVGGLTRPTAEKVREALFDILGERVRGVSFFDLYAGTGAVGIEALSRGAARVVFVESAGRALSALRSNIRALPLEKEEVNLVQEPVAKALRKLSDAESAASIVFSDPPYADEEWPRLLDEIADLIAWTANGLLVLEHHSKSPPSCPPGFSPGKSYRYGDSALSLFYLNGGCSS